MIDMQLINDFMKNESLEGTDKVLKNKCLEIDSALRAAVEEQSKLQQQLNTKNTDVARLNGILEGLLLVIQESNSDSTLQDS